ncbi:MAG: penicillin-binding protein 2 [Alphaproteobacteria bacterium]
MYHDDYSEKIFSRRAFVIGGLQLFGLVVLGARLAWLQIAQGKRYKMLSDKNRINIKILPPPRGEIVDRFGVPLAINTQTYRVLIIPEQTDNIEKSLRALQRIVFVEEDHIARVIKEASKTAKFIPVRIKEGLSWGDVAKVEVRLPDLPGIFIDVGDVRSYPYRDSTAHIVGYVRAISKEDLEQNNPVLRLPGFRIGKTGIEKVYDEKLRGSPGAAEVEVNVVGREVRELKRKDAQPGRRVTLSIDGELQRITQETLAVHKSASAVILDAYTGAIYAMASYPAFDPNMFVRGLTTEEWKDLSEDPAHPQTNKAVSGQYPPGSTFKMITALAGLELGIIKHNTIVHCPGHYEYGQSRYHCWKNYGHGLMNLESALQESCDVYFYKLATKIGIDAIADMARRFGLGEQLGLGLGSEKAGLVPDTAWKRKTLGQPWYPGETIISSIGQGDVLTTPLQLAIMTARMVNGGLAVKPWLTGYVGRQYYGHETWEPININAKHLELVRKGMDVSVNKIKGTAYASRIEQEGMEMGGKTGTAQVRRITAEQRRLGVKNEDLPWKERHHALFVGYAPVAHPRYVCSVVVEHGVGGSTAAAPIAKILLEHTQSRDPAGTKMQPEIIFGQEQELDDTRKSAEKAQKTEQESQTSLAGLFWPPKKPQSQDTPDSTGDIINGNKESRIQ